MKVCTDAEGRLSGEPSVVRTSGSARLDQGAVRQAKAGAAQHQFIPATEDGKSVAGCVEYNVKFQLR